MNTTRFHRLFLVLGSLLALVVAPTVHAADEQPLGTPAGTVTVPGGYTKEDVQDVIAMALAGRGWGVQEKTADKVIGYLKHRSNEATVTFVYNEKQVSLYCVGYKVDKKTGERIKPELPSGWLNNLRSDLTKKLNRGSVGK